MRRKILLGIIILCLIGAALFVPGMVSGDKITRNAVVISEGNYEYESFFPFENKKIDITVDVTSPAGASVDVYILSYSEYSNYPSGSFTPTVAHEDVSSSDFTFKAPDNEFYYLVIDNTDNTRSADAVPSGDVTVDYEYDNPLTAAIDTVEDAAETAVMLCILGVVIIIVVIIVIVVVVIKVAGKGKQPPPQQQYQQQQYPQQGAYPPQGQPYQPPPGEQPPGQPQQQPPGQQGYYPPPQGQEQWPQQQPDQGQLPQQPQQPPNQGQWQPPKEPQE